MYAKWRIGGYGPQSGVRRFQLQRRGSRISLRVNKIFRKLVARGIYRNDLDTATATWTLLSLIFGPLVLAPVRRVIPGLLEAPQAGGWAEHVIWLMRREVLPRPCAVQNSWPPGRKVDEPQIGSSSETPET